MSALPYWITSALSPLPALVWMVAGLGLPWAFAILPRKDWRSGPLVALCAIAFGPMWLTAWMFVLGTVGGAQEHALLTMPNILGGTITLALLGVAIAVYKWRTIPPPPKTARRPLALDERLLVTLIAAACVLRWVAAVWFPFWEYDPLWVYAYEGKLYTLLGYIPQHIGYYPQFLPLQYAFAQIAAGMVDDHAARAVFPIYHWGSILAAYALGRLTLSRRAGVYAAAIWALYPHVGQWATVGDLEIPLTFAFTGAAAFFLAAWSRATSPPDPLSVPERGKSSHVSPESTVSNRNLPIPVLPLSKLESGLGGEVRTYALISGLFLGIALWTKPTGGAFVLGVMLLIAAEAVRVRLDWQRLRPRFEVALWCGIGSIPLGALWYVRNAALGHRVIDFPHPFWLTQAMRSGAEFGWPVLTIGLLIGWLLLSRGLRARPHARRLLLGAVIALIGLLPSVLFPHRLRLIEWAVLIAGAAILIAELLPYYRRHATEQAKRIVSRVGWALLLALPYFAVWFLSYSYHYRLSFPIVPLMILPVAVIASRWIPERLPTGKRPKLRLLVGLPLLLAAIPGLIAPLYHNEGGWDYLWSNEYPDDWSRLDSTNYALSKTVQALKRDIAEQGIAEPVIFAPGLQRLPFFFPLDDVRIAETPTSLDQLRGVDYYVFTQEARWLYEENEQPDVNPVTGSMYRPELMTLVSNFSDNSFFGLTYRVRDVDRRYRLPQRLDFEPEDVTWPFARLLGTRLTGGSELGESAPPFLNISFLAFGPAPLEYTLYVHLLAPDGTLVTTWDSLPVQGIYAWYSTRLWESGEVVTHRVGLNLPEDVTLEPGVDYVIKIGWYDYFDDLARLPVTRADGSTADGLVLPYRFTAGD